MGDMEIHENNGFACMAEACAIFGKYAERYAPFHCEHDKLSVVGVDPRKVTPEDMARLSALGFLVDSDEAEVDEDGEIIMDDDSDLYFMSFRFGSA